MAAFDFLVERAEPVQRQACDVAAGLDAEIGSRGVVGDLDGVVGADDEDRIGQAVDGQLRGLLAAHQAIVVDPLEFAQSRRHGVECFGEFADFITGADRQIQIEIAGSDLAGRIG